MRKRSLLSLALLAVAAVPFALYGCTSVKKEAADGAAIEEGTVDPAAWGKLYPAQYEAWQKTAEPSAPGASKYKRGFEAGGERRDKLDEYPFLALLYNGWAFGTEYNEPRGHAYMLVDQHEVDHGRVKAGGSCLTCKTPYAPALQKQMGQDYFSKPYDEVHARIPVKEAMLGVACVDCHNSRDMSLKISRGFTLGVALKELGVDERNLSRGEKRTLVCAQCHVTYSIPKDGAMKSTNVYFPWQGSNWGNIPIENIIRQIRSNPANLEWTQSVTGFKVGFIRHPEFELFSRNSVHWQAGVSCADCHMPPVKAGTQQVSDHRVTSPLKDGMKACLQCHSETPQALRDKVIAIQDRSVSQLIRAGYATAAVAKLFETTHKARAAGTAIDQALYDQAKEAYLEAFYRVVFIGAENSTGFHNPPETLRVLTDAAAYAAKADALLRQALARGGAAVPAVVDLELPRYLNDRGTKHLDFNPAHEIKDPLAGRNG
ncbi:MAG TPA: ammonia-forming cytochrome c nitrite reductase subunit c552 [Geobacteraceae bacterium]